MISEVLDILKKHTELYGWKMKCTHSDSYQLYFIRQELNMNREVTASEYAITIYTKEDNKIGSSSFLLYSSMSNEEIEEKIKEQTKLCKYTLNDEFNLSKKANLKPISKEVGFDGHSLKDAAFIAADALFEADKYDKGYINSSEVYINFEEVRYFDSNENMFLYTKSYGQIEFVVTWKDKEQEIELYKFIEFNSLDSKYIQDQANKILIEASNRSKAEPTPSVANNVKLLLTGEDVKTYFSFFLNKASVDMVYNKMSNFVIGSQLYDNKAKCDHLSIKVEPTLKNSTKGAPFDDDGIVLKRLNVIDKGQVKALWGSNDKAQYLSLPVHGKYQNIIASGGSLTSDDLKEENYLEVVSFSSFEIDGITGDFCCEIRLAYLHLKNKEVAVVTGGSVSGNVLDSLKSTRYSLEIDQQNNFIGPKGVLIDNVSIMKNN